jgi:hypothetical protein
MRCCAGFFMGDSLSDPEDLLIPFSSTNLPGVCHSCRFAGTVTILLVRVHPTPGTGTDPNSSGERRGEVALVANPQTRAISIG